MCFMMILFERPLPRCFKTNYAHHATHRPTHRRWTLTLICLLSACESACSSKCPPHTAVLSSSVQYCSKCVSKSSSSLSGNRKGKKSSLKLYHMEDTHISTLPRLEGSSLRHHEEHCAVALVPMPVHASASSTTAVHNIPLTTSHRWYRFETS